MISHFESVVLRRVVGSRDVYRADNAPSDDGVGDRRSGRGAHCKQDVESVAGQHFGGGGGEVLREEAPIVANDDRPAGPPSLAKIGGEALRTAADGGESVVLGDAPAPAIGAEGDLGRGGRSEERRVG